MHFFLPMPWCGTVFTTSLLTARRHTLHRAAAQWFDDPPLRAEHLDRAEDLSAADAYLHAAKIEVEQFHFERAAALTERGLEIAQDVATRYALHASMATSCVRSAKWTSRSRPLSVRLVPPLTTGNG